MPYRNSYINDHTSDEESTASLESYINNGRENRKIDRHEDSVGRSLRSSRQSLKSSQLIDDDENENMSRRRHRQNIRERRASSAARSISSKPERRGQQLKSDTTQDSEAELGTRALVQAKIREKVAQASSMDESSSDLWRPKGKNSQVKQSSQEQNKSQSNKGQTKETPSSKPSTVCRIVKSSVPKVSTEVQTTPPRETSREKSVEAKAAAHASNAVDKNNSKQVSIEEEDVPDIGPAPSTPNYEWECEFCTFTNEPNTKICAICCKTPTTVAVRRVSEETTPPINGQLNDQNEISKEGKPNKATRKISFWLGTKSK